MDTKTGAAIGAAILLGLGTLAYTDSADPNREAYNRIAEDLTHRQDLSRLAAQFWDVCKPVISGVPGETREEAEARYAAANGNPEFYGGSLKTGEIIRSDRDGTPYTPGTPVCDKFNGQLSFLDDESRVTDIITVLEIDRTTEADKRIKPNLAVTGDD